MGNAQLHEVVNTSRQTLNGLSSVLGKKIMIDDFNLMYNVECASGFHFFRTREEAENY